MSDWRTLIDRPEWMADANCHDHDTNAFYPTRGQSSTPAKTICRACDVQAECLAYALNTGQHHGVWGGMSEKERRRVRRGARLTGVAS